MFMYHTMLIILHFYIRSVKYTLTGLILPHLFVCPTPGPEFSTTHAVAYFSVNRAKMICDCSFC